MKKLILFLIVIIAVVFLAGCWSSPSAPANTNAATTVQYLENDRRFDGTWEASNKSCWVFYADTFIWYDENGDIKYDGVFSFSNDRLFCRPIPGQRFVVNYNLGELYIIINNESFVKRVILLDERRIPHPLEGTWKGTPNGENIFIYRFFPGGTGISYECDKNLAMLSRGRFNYDVQKPVFTEFVSNKEKQFSVDVTYRVNGNELVFGNGSLVLTRQ